MFVMENKRDLRRRIAYVLIYGPDRFPYEDFLSKKDQMTLDKGFEQLHQGVSIAYPAAKFRGEAWDRKRQDLHDLLDKSHKLFKKKRNSKKQNEARLLLNEFDRMIFG